MAYPANYKYTKEHEWIAVEGNIGSIGITDYAQDSLGDIVFVELPKVGAKVEKGKVFGSVESVKAVSDLYAPVDGEVIETNPDIDDDPGLVNTDPYGAGWLLRIRLSDDGDQAGLLSPEEYTALTKEAG